MTVLRGWGRDRLVPLGLFIGSMCIYLAVSRHENVAYDAASMVGVAHDLVNHFSLQASGGFDDYLHLSTPYSPYGIGLSLVIAPFYALSKLTGHQPAILSVINPLIVATTVVFCYAIGRCLRWSALLAVVASISFGLLTMALQSTTELFSEPAVGLCIAVIVWGMLRWRDHWKFGPLAIGVAAAAAIQFRADSVLTVWICLLALPLFVPWRAIVRPAALLALGIPMALSLVGLCAYNDLRWHSLFTFSYNGGGYDTPLGRGIEGLLFSPGKSFFLFNPLALLGVIGLGVLLWFSRPVGVLFLLLIAPRILLFSKWSQWSGGVDWGPRFLMPVGMLFVIAAVEVLHRTGFHSAIGVVVRAVFVVLCIASVGIGFLSVRVPYEQWRSTLSSQARGVRVEDEEPIITDPTRANLGDAQNFTVQASQIRGDIDLLESGTAQVAPEDFGGDRNPIGGSLLGLGATVLLGSGILAARTDRLRRRGGTPDGPSAVAKGNDRLSSVVCRLSSVVRRES